MTGAPLLLLAGNVVDTGRRIRRVVRVRSIWATSARSARVAKGRSRAARAGAAGAADAVNEAFRLLRKIVIHHVRNVLRRECRGRPRRWRPARGTAPSWKPCKRLVALVLAAVAVDAATGFHAFAPEPLREPVGAAFGAGEDEEGSRLRRAAWTAAGPACDPARLRSRSRSTWSTGLVVEPTSMRTALRTCVSTRCLTELSMVAENNIVWRSPGSAAMIRRTVGRKPMSSMRSASSRIRWRCREIDSCGSRKSQSLPGVASSTCDPALRMEQLGPLADAADHNGGLDAACRRPF
jgi:hypothetical protein